MQGAGKVAWYLCQHLKQEGAKLIVTDIDDAKLKRLVEETGATAVAPEAILGRSNGIKPADVVYSVASTAKISGKEIGAIEIRQNETFVDIPEKHVDAVLRAKNGTIRGQVMKLQRA